MRAELPPDEPARLAALREYDILDTLAEESYDDITRLASEICGTSISAVSLVDVDRQWFKSSVGLEVDQTPRDVAFCAHAILTSDLLVVPDARLDPRFADNPLVTDGPRIRFYAGAPLVSPDGQNLGTLCVIDSVQRDLTEAQAGSLRALSRQVMAQLELRRLLSRQERLSAELEEARRVAELASLTDDVSGFHNTRFLQQYLRQALGEGGASMDALSLVFFDMDGFKAVVDTHGHLLGARVLGEVARVVHAELGPDDRIVRYGGDEYVVLLPGQGRDQARETTERIRLAISSASFLHTRGLDVRVTASFGVATFPDDGSNSEEILQAADHGLFRSKARGKNCVSEAKPGP